ncbi:nicotinate-nucleotide adenylyltransferase [Methyloglobulus sp.]|uniref:nicotinate-nucleotide adenylyltransferase n=1 Tax=Methyloglobulus sp. TaxID=2518622 RepID=UPI00179B4886|nr:nicotinate-nucleotide adenylyltransferase [Methyloglobulus sp.]
MIGIFGGTFDPVHYGHLRSALEVKEIFGLDEVRLILSAKPPHRAAPIASIGMRLEMLQLAVKKQPGFIVDTREIARAGASYMVLTLESLRQEFPNQPLLLFIGSDAFNKLENWHQWQRLFEFAHVVVLTRPGHRVGQLEPFFIERQTTHQTELKQELAGKLYFQAITQLDISATVIRNIFADRRNPAFLLPDSVIAYIKQHKLYQAHNVH